MPTRNRRSPLLPFSVFGLIALVAAASAAACGGGGGDCACPYTGNLDAGPTPAPDASLDGGPELVDPTAGITINGVTDNGLLIYTVPNGGVWSVAFTAGAVPTILTPPEESALYPWGAVVGHHVVVMSSNTPATKVLVWDERTGVSTPLPPPSPAYESFGTPSVSADSQSIVTEWQNSATSASQWFVSKIDGTSSVPFGPLSALAFDENRLVYLALVGNDVGAPGVSLVVLDGANGWSSTTLSTNASGYALDAIGSRALISTGPSPNGGQGVVLAPLDGGAGMVIDPTGGGPMVYLSPDSTLAMYTAEAGTTNAHVVAVALPLSGPPGVPYTVPGDHLETTAGGNLALFGENVDVATNAPGGPVALITSNIDVAVPPAQAIVGVSAGATTPDVALPPNLGDGFTSDQSRVVINRPPSSVQNGSTVALSVFELPSGPESAALATSSTGWLAIGGSRILFTDNFLQGLLELRVADVSKGTTSALVVSDVATYFVSPDGTKVAFTHPNQTSPLGLWIATVPTEP